MTQWYGWSYLPQKTAGIEEPWFHGSSSMEPFEKFDPDVREREGTGDPKHWNCHLGSHFSSEHDTAAQIAFGHSGAVYHVGLAAKNPKHYYSEKDLDRAARNWAKDRDYSLGQDSDPANSLRYSTQVREIAHGFREDLKSKGHDGITYGNEYEGSHLHECAIAFHPEDITIHSVHHASEPCEEGTVCPHCLYPRTDRDWGDCSHCGEDLDTEEPEQHKGMPDWASLTGQSSLLRHFAEHDWRGSHRPAGPEEPALHELPDDLYEHPEYHNGPRPPGSVSRYHCSIEWRDAKRGYENAMGAFQQMKKARGNPEAPVSIYRAVPHHVTDIHSGDWVTLHPGYAQQHGMSNVPEDDDYRILKATVPAKHVNWSQDAFDEWGYNGPDISHAEEHHGRQPELPFHSEDEIRHEGAKEDDDLDFRDAMEQFMDLLASDPSNPPGTVKMLNDPEVRGRFMNHIDKTTPHYAPGTFERHIDDQLKGKEGVKDRPDPDPVEYRHSPPRDPYSEGRPSGHHSLNAFLEGTQIGRLSWWDPGDGPYKDNPSFGPKIDKAEVASEHRRRGLGAEMFRRALEITPGIQHSDRLSGDGRSWRDAVSPEEAGTPAHSTTFQHRLGAKDDDAEYQQRVREHAERQATRPGYSPGDDLSGWDGYPHAEWVPIEVAQRFREHSGVQHAGSEQKVDEIASQLRDGRGMTDPLMLLHHNEENVASLGEGNHRLTAAERAGWSHVPMRVCRMYDSEVKGARGNPPPKSIPTEWRGTHEGRTPEMCSPSDVLSVGSKSLPQQHTAAKEEVCDGTGHLPRAMSREPDGSLVGMCISCMDYHPVTEVIPPSKPEWPKEFRLAPHAPSPPQQHQAAKDTDHSKGVMVALVPPPKVAEALVQEDGTEPVDSLHITLAYLGETTEMTKAQLRDLPEVVAAWAEAEMPLSATTQGAGTFLKADEDGQHVMWASVAIPGVNLMHERLIHALEKGGYSPRTDHEFTPHITLSYEKYHVRFLPKVERMSFDLDEVWCVIAGEWENFSLGSS